MEDTRSPSPSVDFLSPEFDPVRVLRASPSRVQLPCPSVQACDNLDAYQSVVQGTRRQWVEPVGGAKKEMGGATAAEITQSVQPKRKFSTVLDFMQNPQLETFSVLQHCHGNQERVRVWIRHCAGVRGVCEGVLLAFDKHFNLVLGDVAEEYSPFKTLANGGRSKKRKKRKKRKKKMGGVDSNPLPASSAAGPTEESGEEHSGPAASVMPPAVLSEGATSSDEYSCTASIAVSSEKTVGVGAATEKPQVPALSTKSPTSHSDRLSRHVGQLFVRGDNVILIAPAQPKALQ